MSDPISDAIVAGFDELAPDQGHRIWLTPGPLAIPAERDYVEELKLGGIGHSVDGGLTFKKADLPKAFAVGDSIWMQGGEYRVVHIETDPTDPLVHLAYQLVDPPRWLPAHLDEGQDNIVYGGGADQGAAAPSNQFWSLQVIQPENGGTIEVRGTDGELITETAMQDGTRLEVHIALPETVSLVQWNGDLQVQGNKLTFLHTLSNHLTISATTTAKALRVYTDLPGEGGIFNWQTGQTHPAGQPLTLTYQPPSEQHVLSHFQINGQTVADGDSTTHGDVTIADGTITLSNPQVDVTVEAVLEHDCPQPVPTLGDGVTAPDPLPGPGEEAIYTVTIPTGQELVRWELDGEEIEHNENGSVTITQPAGEFTLEAILQTIVYTITIPTIDEGTILVSNTNPEHGEDIGLTFVPAAGYSDTTEFTIGEATIAATNNVATWTADRSGQISVDSEIFTYTLTANFPNPPEENFTYTLTNTITGDPITTNPIPHGTQITLQVTPNEGYEFDQWDAHPLIANTSHNPLNIVLTQDADLTANVIASFGFTTEYTILDGSGSEISYANDDLLTEDNLELVVSGALIHNLIGNGPIYTTVQDALYPFWQQGYGGNDAYFAFVGRYDHTDLNAAIPESGVGIYRNTANGTIEIAETLTTPRVLASINNGNNIGIDVKHVQLAVRFNSNIGYIPLPLIPYLNNAQQWQDASFIPSVFQGGDITATKSVADVKAALALSGQGGSDHNNYQIGKELQDVQDDAAGFTNFIKDFNQYTIPIHMADIETALGWASGRQNQIDFALVSTGLDVDGTTITGLVSGSPTKIDGAFKLDLTLE